MTESMLWAAIIGAALGSYLLRSTPFMSDYLAGLGRRYIRFLTYMSFAVAAGIVSRSLFLSAGEIESGMISLIKICAVLSALLIYHWLRKAPVSLLSGIAIATLLYWWID